MTLTISMTDPLHQPGKEPDCITSIVFAAVVLIIFSYLFLFVFNIINRFMS